MFARALVNDIKGNNARGRSPSGADVDIDLCRFLSRDDFHVIPIPIPILTIWRLVRENGFYGHTFAQEFSYPFHFQSTSGSFRSDLEGGFGSFDEGRRNGSPAWDGESVGTGR